MTVLVSVSSGNAKPTSQVTTASTTCLVLTTTAPLTGLNEGHSIPECKTNIILKFGEKGILSILGCYVIVCI